MTTKLHVADMITQIELAAIKRDRAALASLRADAAALADSLQTREQDIIARIEIGVACDGVATVIDRRRQNISWLTVIKRELGEAAVLQAKNEWPITFYKELQIG